MNIGGDLDAELRLAAQVWLRTLLLTTHGYVRREDVAEFRFAGERIPLMDRQRGIRKPRMLDAALSFRTVHADRPDLRPYDDSPGPDSYLRYKWRGSDPSHPENRAMRLAYERRLPLLWFRGVQSGWYLPVFPVWLVGEEPDLQQFVVALDVDEMEMWEQPTLVDLDHRRRYVARTARTRLHQPMFRARVMLAYRQRCSLCRLAHPELLDAAHILADNEGGEPVVPNGIAMCKIHHAAYDANIVGIDPDYRVLIRPDVLDESDGPTLRHALQALHQSPLQVIPRKKLARPNRDLLAARFERFRQAS